ncbi:polysaccharide biosynthesis C-terminal domain-containing protein [Desulfobacula toluolica]|uniref:CapF: capsular polysaccharide synthesis enzyme n=1 Tax=Desulfobacula toluolica (strain DSM 7467 / Tol2) TaxID=651182 RepID=K0NDU7_DESTT|nr:NAD-dependent epimerase/dehydratase family protein [Desulfobacula toluolica]CCK78980.1 CapF: capsular polysaccharide synthesis enzyme [Desulfobacula toluolica Tol2]
MIKVGITGQSGFVGSHLFNYLGLKENIQQILFEKFFFDNFKLLKNFVSKCDVIVHLAAVNRHENPEILYETNISLIKKLISACSATESKPHIIFSSSTQEEGETPYGKSKHNGRCMFEEWANRNNSKFTGLIIPNVYGPFGKPYHNSVVATFCYQLNHGEKPKIHLDGTLKLIYINELVDLIFRIIIEEEDEILCDNRTSVYQVPSSQTANVSEILSILTEYKNEYMGKGCIPNINDSFRLNLFHTFRCYMPDDYFPCLYQKYEDNRGEFVELLRANSAGQSSYSLTKPGITRGDHYHTRKAERFAVVKGKCLIQLRRIGTNNVIEYELDGKAPAFVDIPIWYTHNIVNIGDEDLYTFFWINEFYDHNDPDTYFEKVIV